AIECDRGSRPASGSRAWIKPERDQAVPKRRILERLVRDRIGLVFVYVIQRQGAVRPGSENRPTGPAKTPRHRCASAVRIQRERGFVGVPGLSGQREIVARSEDVWLLEIHADALVEGGITRLHAGGSRAAKEIHVSPVDLYSGLLFAAISDAEIHLAMFAL